MPKSCATAADRPPPPAIRADGGVVQRVDPLEDDGWDAKLRLVPSASFFHGAAWARVLRDTYGFQPVYFTLDQDPAVSAATVLPDGGAESPAILPRPDPPEFRALLERHWIAPRQVAAL